MKKKYFVLLIPAVIIAIDQFTKNLVIANMNLGDKINIIEDWFKLKYVHNEGIAFSMFEGNGIVTIFFTIILLLLCLFLVSSTLKNGDVPIAITFAGVLGGGLSNLIDRIFRGYVIDMISVGNFAVFNVADMFVTCSCIFCIIYIIYNDKFGNGKGF